MQEVKEYAGGVAPVKSGPGRTGFGQRMECRITTRGGALRLVGTLAEVMDWMQAQCPSGKMCELAEVTQ